MDALVSVAPLASRWIERLLATHEPPLTLAQFLALRAVEDEPVTAGELARRAGVSDAAVSQLVSALEDARLIKRAREPDDRRRYTLALTPEGSSILRSANQLVHSGLDALLADLPRPEVDHLARLLEPVAAMLGGSPPPPRPPPPRPHHRRP
ncbi:MAG TPA: MarR family transcriptional regulator [Gaiellaceae bacterium]